MKKCRFEGSESFPYREENCQKIYFINEQPIIKVNYAINGWQIIDSIVFKKKGGEISLDSYSPDYDWETREIKKYRLVSKDRACEDLLSKPINDISDKYRLTEEYLLDLQFLLGYHPVRENKLFKFKEGLIPSIFANYGISYDEPIYSFSYSMDGGLIAEDSFNFESHSLTRKYEYDKQRLSKVQIKVVYKQTNITSTFKETFSSPDKVLSTPH